jgi:phosphotransferase system  glucose/maltose/N-acetylglucosamine-specific IIC component
MTKETFVFFSGIFLTLVPFLGLPEAWRQYAVAVVGILLIIVGYVLRRVVYLARIDKGNGERGTDSFVETTQPLFEDHELK